MTMTFQTSIDLEDNTEVDVTISYTAYYDPGKYSGPWGDCYPAYGEITSMEIFPDNDVSMAEFNKVVDTHRTRLEDLVWDHFYDNLRE